MLLREIDEKFADLKDVDVAEDLHHFMHNDSGFYRKVLFPAISALKVIINRGTNDSNEMHFKPCIEKAIPAYCTKFNVKEKEILKPEEIQKLAEKMYHEEKVRIGKGEYDRGEKYNG